MTGVPFHTCGAECPAYGKTKSKDTACFFGYTGRGVFRGRVVSDQACINTVDRKLLKSLRAKLNRVETKIKDAQIHRNDLRELVATLEIVLSHKGQ